MQSLRVGATEQEARSQGNKSGAAVDAPVIKGKSRVDQAAIRHHVPSTALVCDVSLNEPLRQNHRRRWRTFGNHHQYDCEEVVREDLYNAAFLSSVCDAALGRANFVAMNRQFECTAHPSRASLQPLATTFFASAISVCIIRAMGFGPPPGWMDVGGDASQDTFQG